MNSRALLFTSFSHVACVVNSTIRVKLDDSTTSTVLQFDLELARNARDALIKI